MKHKYNTIEEEQKYTNTTQQMKNRSTQIQHNRGRIEVHKYNTEVQQNRGGIEVNSLIVHYKQIKVIITDTHARYGWL